MREILLVEDYQPLSEKLVRQLERRSFIVNVASSAARALEMASASMPDLVLLDVGLSHMTGYQVAQKLKANKATSQVPILGMTLFKSVVEREKCMRAGCDDCETKPILFPRLLHKLQVLLTASEMIKTPLRTTAKTGQLILVVDDFDMNRTYLSKWLSLQGHLVMVAENGRKALELVARHTFDLILLDIVMPELDGFGVLAALKQNVDTCNIPVIMISALQEAESAARCIEEGAEDFLSKPFNSILLRARIGACLEKKRLRDQEHNAYLSLLESQEMLASELKEAASYVCSLLPPPLTSPIKTDWRFIPSTQLGGDAFGYQWLDKNLFAMFLLDVRGHGVGAAMLSISVMNLLRSQNLLAADLHNPASVLTALNQQFQMETQNERYFTIWYGVYNTAQQCLTYSNAGHPPAVIVHNPESPTAEASILKQPGVGIGISTDSQYGVASCQISSPSRLFIFSDGAFEIGSPADALWSLKDFMQILVKSSGTVGVQPLDYILENARHWHGGSHFEDDYSILQVDF